MKSLSKLIVGGMIIWCFPVLVSAQSQDTTEYYMDQVGLQLNDLINSTLVRGATASVYYGDGYQTITRGIKSNGVPTESNGWYMFRSLTKTMVSTVILQLQEEGKLTIDDALSDHIDAVRNVDMSITLRELLSMRANVCDFSSNSWSIISQAPEAVLDVKEVLEETIPLGNCNSSNAYEYNDTNFQLLGLVIEAVTGNTGEDEFENRLFAPLGNNTMSLAPLNISEASYNGLWSRPGGPGTQVMDVGYVSKNSVLTAHKFSGGVVGSTEDAVRFIKALMEGEYLSIDSMEEMRSLGPENYGLGLMKRDFDDSYILYGHGGSGLHASRTFYDPVRKIGVSVAGNYTDSENMEVMLQNIYTLLVWCREGGGCQSNNTLYFPPVSGDEWETITLQEAGFNDNSESLQSVDDYMNSSNGRALIVLKDGKIVLEKYYNGFSATDTMRWYNAGTPLVNIIAGQLENEGVIKLDTSSQAYLGEGYSSMTPEQEAAIKMADHLKMTSGLAPVSVDEGSIAKADLQFGTEPGTSWTLNSADINLFKQAMENASGLTLNELTDTYVEAGTGIQGTWKKNNTNDNVFYYSTARNAARMGLLMLNQGNWADVSLLMDNDYYAEIVSPSQDFNKSYGYLTWLNGQESYINPDDGTEVQGPLLPELGGGFTVSDMFGSVGGRGQFFLVFPSENVVIIRLGEQTESTDLQQFGALIQSLTGVITSNNDVTHSVPESFDLDQNYPNPFNPTTNISFEIPAASMVTLKVYNMLGQEVATLVNSRLNAGQHTISFDAGNLSSGVYLYRISSGSFTSVRKMTLIK
ncbi:serine hydrolase [Balneola sp. MJW-20]|uniref:serine hydrolase n=1 Tax=Gracilimonas aurantiaca TaxID=3234185 RepID=UPI00346636AA